MTVIPPSYYTLDPDAKTITFTAPYNILTSEEILSIRDLSKQIMVYNSSDPRHNTSMLKPDEITQDFDIQIVNGVLSYIVTATLGQDDNLHIEVSDFSSANVPINVNVVNSGSLSPTAAALTTSSLIFTSGDILTTEKKTDALTLSSLSSSGNYIISVTKPSEDTAGDLTLQLYNQVKTDGVNTTDQLVTTLTVGKITGSATNRSFIVTGLGAGEGTIKIGGMFAANCAVATTLNFAIYAI